MPGKRNPSSRRSKTQLRSSHHRKNSSKPRKRQRRSRSEPPPSSNHHDLSNPTKGPYNIKFPETLGYPIQSPMDPKSYKIIKLKNGLKAILIADSTFHTNDIANVEMDVNCLDKRISKFNKNIMQTKGSSSSGRPCKPGQCCSSTSTTTNVKIKRNSNSNNNTIRQNYGNNKARVYLTVSAGSFNDPIECLGLAHFCEHMMVNRSEKYPTPGELDKFITINGGELNAYTSGHTTSFVFHIDYEYEIFLIAMDMFANLFISPILNIKQIKEQLQIVESEFQSKINNEFEKRIQILQNIGKQNHPVCHFSWGNISTLQPLNRNDETLLNFVHDFYNKYYSSEHMTLIIEAPEPIEIIEKWVVDIFTTIPNTGMAKFSLIDQPFPYDTNEFRKFYSMITTLEIDVLFITWELPSESWKNYKSKPLDYISRALSSKSSGSLGCCLSERYLISHIEANVGNSVHERTECSVLFWIRFNMTKLGTQNVSKILEMTFGYIKYLYENKPQEYFFNELQVINSLKFHFNNDHIIPNELDYALRYYPSQHVLTGNILITNWDPICIQNNLKMLIPSSANFMIMSKSIDFCDQIEPYFQTHYHVQDVPKKLLEKLENPIIYTEFKPFLENRFLTTNFCFVPLPNDDMERKQPSIVFHDKIIELWHFIDITEGCVANYYFHFISKLGTESVQNATMMEIFIKILQYSLEPILHGCTEGKFYYNISRTLNGILICVNGFSQKIELVVNLIFEYLFHKNIFNSRNNFNSAKNTLLQLYYNECITPRHLNRHLRLQICNNKFWMAKEMYEGLILVEYELFIKIVDRFKSSFYIIGYIHGNISCTKAIQFARKITKQLQCFVYESDTNNPEVRSNQLPLGKTILRVKNMNKNSKTSFISNYYQIGYDDPNTRILCDFFANFMRIPAFQQLRDVEKLCYGVDVEMIQNIGSCGILISIHTESDRFNGTHIMRRIDNFLSTFFRNNVETMTKNCFQIAKQSIKGYPQTRPAEINWKEILNGSFDFQIRKTRENMMKKINLIDVKKWYAKYLLQNHSDILNDEKNEVRILSIQVVGCEDNEYKIECIQPSQNERDQFGEKLIKILYSQRKDINNKISKFSIVVLLPPDDGKIRKKCVDNIIQFQRSLLAYPVTTSKYK